MVFSFDVVSIIKFISVDWMWPLTQNIEAGKYATFVRSISALYVINNCGGMRLFSYPSYHYTSISQSFVNAVNNL